MDLREINMVRGIYFSIILCLFCAGCSDVAPAQAIVISADQGQVSLDGEIMTNPEPDMARQQNPIDMGVPVVSPDMAVEADAF